MARRGASDVERPRQRPAGENAIGRVPPTTHRPIDALRRNAAFCCEGPGGHYMPLTRGTIIGYDADRMMFEFTMLTPDARVVSCQISSIALDYMVGKRGTLPSEREAQFIHLRDAIEKIASDNFQGETALVRIFAKHLPQEQKRFLEY
jgi:Protein of unknown function (DUF1488)